MAAERGQDNEPLEDAEGASDEGPESSPSLAPSRWVVRFSHLVRPG